MVITKIGYNDVHDILLVLCDTRNKLTIYPMDYKVGKPMLE